MSKLPRFKGSSIPVFEKRTTEPDLHPSVIKQARKTGQLNLANKGLVAVPDQVWNMNAISIDESRRLSQSWDSSSSSSDDRWWDQVELNKLNLSSNKITHISTNISLLSSLIVLDLHDNMIVKIPEQIGELKHLTHINLSRNRLTDLPTSFFTLKDLRVLKIGHNDLSCLDDDIGNLNLLEELDLCNNRLLTIPATIGFLSRVIRLNLSENRIQTLPNDIGGMMGLQCLDLTHNELKEIPYSVGDLLHLTQLHLRHNNLEKLPSLHGCNELKEFYLGNNFLKELNSESFASLCKLKVLDLRDNKLDSLPNELATMLSLERLDLTNNELNSLPQGIGLLTNLKSLSLEGNPLRSVRKDILQRGTVQLLKFLRNRMTDDSESVASGSNNTIKRRSFVDRLAEIDVFTLRKTRCLDCSGHQADFIPDDLFAKAAQAEVNIINLGKNQLTEIPRSIEVALPLLTELTLASNKLTEISGFLSQAKFLQFLDISQNRLSDLPKEMHALVNLREIWLTANRFTKLPSVLYDLPKLEILLASDNGIESIDVSGLTKLKLLSAINLQNNNIFTVPPELGNLTQLRTLQLEGNPFRHPRPAILPKGTVYLLEYLRDRIPK